MGTIRRMLKKKSLKETKPKLRINMYYVPSWINNWNETLHRGSLHRYDDFLDSQK